MLIPKNIPLRDKNHLAFVRSLPCLISNHECGGETQACHIRRGTDGSMGVKPSDNYTIPLCHVHHTLQHNKGEITFHYTYIKGGFEAAIACANHIYKHTGDRVKALQAMAMVRR